MIEKLQIRGFGANKKLDIEFSPCVTSIIGKSFIGKSWLLRALKWVALNKPAGDSYINWDSDEAKVRLSIDGRKVIRVRSKRDNSYRLSGKKSPYVAFGNEVPREIAEIINLSELNFQGQHSTPFWFYETAGEVSRQLNSIVNLEIIDKTLANIESEKRETSVLIKVTKESLSKAVQERERLSYVRNLNEELEDVEKLQSQYEKAVRDHSTIDEKIKLVAKLKSIRENRLRLVSDANLVISIGDKYSKIAESVEELSRLVKSAQDLQSVLAKRPPSIKPLERLKVEVEQLEAKSQKLRSALNSIENQELKKCKAKEALQKYQKEIGLTTKGKCPLCGAKIKS